MAFRKIENISWNGNPTGEAFGGHIYALTMQMGYTDGPTKVTLSIVNETGTYTAKDKEGNASTFKDLLSTRELNTLKIGDLDPFYLHIVGYEIRTTVGQRVLTLQLSDTSVLLDKIFVGLVNRHAASTGQTPYGSSYGSTVTAEVDGLRLRCLKCDGTSDTEIVTPGETTITGASGGTKKYKSIKREVDVVQSAVELERGKAYVEPYAPNHFVKDGGMIILGKEGFVEQECDVPEVDYNFTELLAALWEGNIKNPVSAGYPEYISIAKDANGNSTLPDRNVEYRQQYTGTLREVLNSWCADFGYSFTWNLQSEKPEIVGIDLSKDRLTDPVTHKSYIENIKDVIKQIQGQANEDSAVVESITENASLENTYKAGYVSQYLKPARTKETNRVYYKKKMFYNVPIEAITTPAERFNMPMHQFIISCALAKYSTELRRHYLYSIGVGSSQAVRNALGIVSYQNMSKAERDFILASMESAQKNQIVRKFEHTANNFGMALVKIDDDAAATYERWQSDIATNFMGQYYYAPVEQEEVESRNCDSESESVHETHIEAGGQVERFPLNDALDVSKLPFTDVMVSPKSCSLQNVIPYIDLSKEGEHGYDPKFFLNEEDDSGTSGTSGTSGSSYQWQDIRKNSKEVYIFKKEAPWGTPQEAVDAWKTYIPVGDFNVHIIPLTGAAKLMFRNAITRYGSSFSSGVRNAISGDDNWKIIIFPSAQGMRGGFSVRTGIPNASVLGGAVSRLYTSHYFNGAYLGNPYEKVYASQGEESDTNNNPECKTVCETSLVEQVCGHCNYDSDLNKMFVGYPEWTGWKETEEGEVEPTGVVAEYFRMTSKYSPSRGMGPGLQPAQIEPVIILPVMQPYQGYVKRTVEKKKTIDAIKKVLGSALPKPVRSTESQTTTIDGVTSTYNKYSWDIHGYQNNSMGVKVLENLITNDADAIININDPETEGEGIVQVVVPLSEGEDGADWDTLLASGKLKSMTLEEYHDKLYEKFKNDSIGSSLPSENYSFSLVGLAFTEITGLKDLLKPEKGLLSLGVSIDESGVVSDISFGTRPPVNPKGQVFVKKIEPKINVFAR